MKSLLFTFVSVFILSAMVVTSSAQERVVGVTVGDWFRYGDIIFNFNSNDPDATIPLAMKQLNETEWTMLAIVDVSVTNVTGQLTTHFKNGTEEIVGGYVDIDTGEGENMTTFVVSANLEENDTVYTSVMYSIWKINETIVQTYPDSVRDTNHLNMTSESSWGGTYVYVSTNYYWDKSTGILVELSQEYILQTEDYATTWSMLMGITEANVWVVPEFPTWTSVLMLIVLTLTIAIYKRRLLKTPIH